MDVPFESFAELIYRLGNPPVSKRHTGADGRRLPLPPDRIFTSWINHLPRTLLPKTGTRIFRLLFPHEGNRRRYGLRETKLALELERLLGIAGLTHWDAVGTQGAAGQGCLGDVVGHAVSERLSPDTRSTITLSEVDVLLDELAALSPFSQMSQVPIAPRPTGAILNDLYRGAGMSPRALAVLTQIILRDLRPLLNPLPPMRVRHPTLLLRVKSTAAPAQLGLHEAMWCWDPVMARLYRDGKGCMEWCAATAEAVATAGGSAVVPIASGPIVGVNVQIPKCIKGRSVKDALKGFVASRTACRSVWAETKYDGYRMQIHVEVYEGMPKITVFSKSKRQSTGDRRHTHAIILAALGLAIPPHMPAHPALLSRLPATPHDGPSLSSIIVEAEVIPYNEGDREGGRGPGIEEFWRLQAAGVSADIDTPHLPLGPRHLCLAFFDVLHRNGESLIDQPYHVRRRMLESVIRPIKGFSMVASRVEIPLHLGVTQAEEILRRAFDRSIERREEGLVLKADESAYIDSQLRWVKLKKDYIPNVGDCADLVVLGAGWDLDRARELRVDTSVYTTFYIGTLTNREAVARYRQAPHFEFLFRASYGVSREQLELYNDNIRLKRWGSKPFDKDDPWKRRLIGLSWKYTMPKDMKPPSVLLEQPLCAEVMGAGFQRLPSSKLYELRWPRLLKIFDRKERPWTEALDAPALLKLAHESLGYTVVTLPIPTSPEDDSIRALWRSRSTAVVDVPDISPTPKRQRRLEGRRKSAPTVLKLSPPSPARVGDLEILRSRSPPTSPLASRRRLLTPTQLGAPLELPSPGPPARDPAQLADRGHKRKRPAAARLPSPPTSSPRAAAPASASVYLPPQATAFAASATGSQSPAPSSVRRMLVAPPRGAGNAAADGGGAVAPTDARTPAPAPPTPPRTSPAPPIPSSPSRPPSSDALSSPSPYPRPTQQLSYSIPRPRPLSLRTRWLLTISAAAKRRKRMSMEMS